MSKNTSTILGDQFADFIQEEIKLGRYKNKSEVIQSGLRLLETENAKIEAINSTLIIGETSGKPRQFNNEAFKSKMKKRLKWNA